MILKEVISWRVLFVVIVVLTLIRGGNLVLMWGSVELAVLLVSILCARNAIMRMGMLCRE